MKNRCKKLEVFQVALGIDFWLIHDGFLLQVGSQNQMQFYTKSCRKNDAKMMIAWMALRSHMAVHDRNKPRYWRPGTYSPKMVVNSSRLPWASAFPRLAIKSCSFLYHFYNTISNRFLFDFDSQHGGKIYQNSIPRTIYKTYYFLHRFFMDFDELEVTGTSFLSFPPPWGAKVQYFDRLLLEYFWIVFGTIFESILLWFFFVKKAFGMMLKS